MMRETIAVFVFASFGTMYTLSHAYDSRVNCTFSMARKGYVWKPDNSPFIALKTQGVIRCSSFCCNLSNCCSFNYHSDTSECEIMSASAVKSSDLVVSKFGTYYKSSSRNSDGPMEATIEVVATQIVVPNTEPSSETTDWVSTPTVVPTTGHSSETTDGVSAPLVVPTTGPSNEPTSEVVPTPTVGSTTEPSSETRDGVSTPTVVPSTGPSSEPTSEVVSTSTVGSTAGPSSEATSEAVSPPAVSSTTGPSREGTPKLVSAPTVGSTAGPSSEATSETVSTPIVGCTTEPSSAATSEVGSTAIVGSTTGPSSEATSEIVSIIESSSSDTATETVETNCFNSPYSTTLDIPPYSGCYVGVSTAAVPASSFNSSSGQQLAHFARLGCQQSADMGGWIGNSQGWVQVDLFTLTTVYGIITQGGVCGSVNDCPSITHGGSSGLMYYTNTFKVSWTLEIVTSLFWTSFSNPSEDMDDLFIGNTDSDTAVLNWFSGHEVIRYLRVYIITFVNSPALRFELVNCSSGEGGGGGSSEED